MYPTMDELAAQLLFVLSHFGLKSVIGFGVGAGANILARFAHAHPDKVGALCLINCVSTQSGWIEWGYQSFNARFLRTKGMTQGVIDYLMWHHFGRNPEERNHDLVQMYKQHFERGVNPTNLAMLINAYIHRNDLHLARTPPGTPGTEAAATTLKMPVINITGSLSPHVDDTVTFNGRLDPTNSSWMKVHNNNFFFQIIIQQIFKIFYFLNRFPIALWCWRSSRPSWPKPSGSSCRARATVSVRTPHTTPPKKYHHHHHYHEPPTTNHLQEQQTTTATTEQPQQSLLQSQQSN